MKKIILAVSLLAACSLAGCSTESVTPVENPTSERSWITLPSPQGLSIEQIFTESKKIKGSSGGEIILDENYKGGIHGEVKVIAKLLFRSGSFSGTQTITMSVDSENGTVTFSPSMDFNKDAELYVKLEGLDLRNTNPRDIDFQYFCADGNFYPVNYKEIIVDKSSGILELKEGKISHFSRYGFTKGNFDCW